MPFTKLPNVDRCCICVRDLRTAVAIIAVLGIVTSPVVSWAIVRHSYVIRVSCFVTSSAKRPDIVDINLNNVLSFGFGANAGLGPSCLRPRTKSSNNTEPEPPPKTILRSDTDPASPKFVTVVKGIGWVVLLGDLVFILFSLILLVKLFKGPPTSKPVKMYMWALVVTSLMSFVYGILFIIICIAVGGALPLFELFFAIFDLLFCIIWVYFIFVVRSYINQLEKPVNKTNLEIIKAYYNSWLDYFYLWLYFLMVVNSYRRRYTSEAGTVVGAGGTQSGRAASPTSSNY